MFRRRSVQPIKSQKGCSSLSFFSPCPRKTGFSNSPTRHSSRPRVRHSRDGAPHVSVGQNKVERLFDGTRYSLADSDKVPPLPWKVFETGGFDLPEYFRSHTAKYPTSCRWASGGSYGCWGHASPVKVPPGNLARRTPATPFCHPFLTSIFLRSPRLS